MATIRPPVTSAATAAAYLLVVTVLLTTVHGAQLRAYPKNGLVTVGDDVHIDCTSDEMLVTISVGPDSALFNGKIYPKGLSKNSTCLHEYQHQGTPLRYRLPLSSCNTMSSQTDDGGIEYFNTIVVQPHLKLVTNRGRGFHIRCLYKPREKIISNNVDVNLNEQSEKVTATAPMPGCSMRIWSGDPGKHHVAEEVKIGDPLTLVISLDKQEAFGLSITECLVRDGLGWSEQRLIDQHGCPVDREIMGPFSYSYDKTNASVRFQAHKFPYTASVYYQCNVRLCLRAPGGDGCIDSPPDCETNGRRRRRQAVNDDGSTPATIEVYSGLYVNDAAELAKRNFDDDVFQEKTPDDPNAICISQRNFAIGIAIAGLVLMLAVLAAILILLSRRRRRKELSTTGSSIYSGPYTNTAYSHTS